MAERTAGVLRLRRRVAGAAALFAGALALAGCGSQGGGVPAPARGPNVLVVIMDTTRADRFGCYGNSRGLTPELDRVAAAGARFADAHAHAPWTLPSIGSALTSQNPLVHGAGSNLENITALRPQVRTLAETFKAAGYRTGAVLNVIWLGPKYGLTRGFDHVDFAEETSNLEMRVAAKTTDAALAWIGGEPAAPFFAVVHYFDPHLAYNPPPEYRRRFADPRDRDSREFLFGTINDMKALRAGQVVVPPDLVLRLSRLYDGEIAYTDHEIGRLVAELRGRAHTRDTVIALIADHGEEFLDHGGFEHGHSLYEEILHVPFLLSGPGVPPGTVVPDSVGLIDLAPTLCELAGVPVPADFGGRSLVPALKGQSLAPRAVMSEGNMWGPPLYALRQGKHKLIRLADRQLLFDLTTDPREFESLAGKQPAVAAQLGADLDALRRSLGRGHETAAPSAPLSPEDLERLRSLGYAR